MSSEGTKGFRIPVAHKVCMHACMYNVCMNVCMYLFIWGSSGIDRAQPHNATLFHATTNVSVYLQVYIHASIQPYDIPGIPV